MLEYLAKAIVDDPESVVVEVEEGRSNVSLRLNVSPDDMGRVIGRRGRTAQAIRTVVRAAATRDDTDVDIATNSQSLTVSAVVVDEEKTTGVSSVVLCAPGTLLIGGSLTEPQAMLMASESCAAPPTTPPRPFHRPRLRHP